MIATIRALFDTCESMDKLWIAAHPNSDYADDTPSMILDETTDPPTPIQLPLPIVETLTHPSEPLKDCTTLEQVQTIVTQSFV